MSVSANEIVPLPLSLSSLAVEKILQNQRLALAVSGGLDSMVLLYNIWLFTKSNPSLEICCLHVNFGLRGDESDADEDFVRSICAQFKIPFFVKRNPDRNTDRSGIQDWARNFRHDWFQLWQDWGWFVALGHNRDDLKENAFFRALRGHPEGSILGMSEFDGSIVRPLIGISREEIRKWAKKQGISWREDSSNQKLIYARNIIRHKIFPNLDRAGFNCSEALFQMIKAVDIPHHFIVPNKNFVIPPFCICELRFSYNFCVYFENPTTLGVEVSSSNSQIDQKSIHLAPHGIMYGEKENRVCINWADLGTKKTQISHLLIWKHH